VAHRFLISIVGTRFAIPKLANQPTTMRRLLLMLLASLSIPAFAVDEEPVPLKPFRPQAPVNSQARAVYTVVEGDTIYSISRRFGRDPKLLLWLNRLEEGAVLPVGKVVFIGDAPVVVR
jgi:LysM repeat protein